MTDLYNAGKIDLLPDYKIIVIRRVTHMWNYRKQYCK